MVLRLPDGAAMLTRSGSEMPRKQNEGWLAVLPATETDADPSTLDAAADTSADDLPVLSNTNFVRILKKSFITQ